MKKLLKIVGNLEIMKLIKNRKKLTDKYKKMQIYVKIDLNYEKIIWLKKRVKRARNWSKTMKKCWKSIEKWLKNTYEKNS